MQLKFFTNSRGSPHIRDKTNLLLVWIISEIYLACTKAEMQIKQKARVDNLCDYFVCASKSFVRVKNETAKVNCPFM